MAARLPDSVWASIRTVWEYDPDEPSYTVAAERAGQKHGFSPPKNGSISKHLKSDAKKGDPWERRGSLSGINSAAHRKADHTSTNSSTENDNNQDVTAEDGNDGNGSSTKKEQAARIESENLRADLISRHRQEWNVSRVLLNEAIADRKGNTKEAFEKAKLAKISTEIIKIRQDGERKAWGLDDLGNFDPTKLSDDQLDKIIAGG
jgi:hypothetical protein